MANNYPNLTNAAIRFAVGAVIFLVIAGLASSCMTTSIDSGHQGVKFNPLGGGTNLEDIYGEGLQVFLPWERMIEYDVRVKSASEEIEALSSNGASIGMEITIRYRPDREALPELHQTYGQNYYEQLIQPEIRSAAREVVGQYTPEDLYSAQRTSLQQQIMDQLEAGVEDQFVDIDAVLIRDVQLPDQVRQAIEEKLREEQRVQQAALQVERSREEANQKRVEAQGDADRARIITESLSPQFLQFQGIQATREIAQSDNAKVIIVGNGGGEGGGLPVILGGQ